LEHEFYFPFHIWDNPNPIDSYFSRWLKPPTRQSSSVNADEAASFDMLCPGLPTSDFEAMGFLGILIANVLELAKCKMESYPRLIKRGNGKSTIHR